jgi:hypothetical protein
MIGSIFDGTVLSSYLDTLIKLELYDAMEHDRKHGIVFRKMRGVLPTKWAQEYLPRVNTEIHKAYIFGLLEKNRKR